MTRHEAREQAFLLLFDKSFHPDLTVRETIDLAAEDGMIELDASYAELVTRICDTIEDIDARIERNLKGWKVSRISRVSLALLRLAVGELLYTDTPQGVVVNEAVLLSKCYAAEEETAFINGTLRNMLRSESE
jgi:N utilization substance protein B